jgi:hypothetical protein
VSLGQHLGRRILLGGFAVPSWVLSAASVCGAALFASVATGLVVGAVAGPATAPAASSASAAPPPPPPASADVPLVELAAAGEPDAMKQLESKPAEQRTVGEIVALADGEAVKRKAELGALGNDLRRNPKLGEDPDVLRRLHEATKNPELAREALRMLATASGHGAVDVIYEVWVGTRGKTPTTQLAKELVFTKEVRAKASPALAVALDLRSTKDCEETKAIVQRAIEHADRRSVRLLGKLSLRYGCGPRKNQDCYACLRGEHLITDAITAARKRPTPKL